MRREYTKWFSPSLGREMEILAFGHAGLPAVVFPTSCGTFFEFENRRMVAAVEGKIEAGQLQLFCVDSVDAESWYNRGVSGRWKIARQIQYENYVMQEVIPHMRRRNQNPLLAAVGCSFGGYHAVNMTLRYPDVFTGCLSMSGAFDMSSFLRGYHDEDCYFHQPLQYLSNMTDEWYLERYRRNSYVLATAEHDQCWDANEKLAAMMRSKGIPVRLDVWEAPARHDWPWWERMIAQYL